MKIRFAVPGGALVLLLLASLLSLAPARAQTTPGAGFSVQDGRLVDANGNDFVVRGVNHPHVWFQQETQAFGDIAALGANAVRVVLGSGQRWGPTSAAEVGRVVDQCRQHRLVCVLEVHDTTGYGEQQGAASLAQAVDWWIGVRQALAGTEHFVIVNIGNEPHGNDGFQAWTADTSSAIRRLRGAGFDHTLLVDGPNWGQDWSNTMREHAPTVFAADPDGNTVFSIHMYGVYDTAAEVDAYLDSFVSRDLPIVVGEFGHDHSDGNPDEDAILAAAERLDIGYLGWSWSGNGGGVEYLDLVRDFDRTQLTPWGQRLFNGPDGIRATAREASVFGGSTPPSTTTTTASPATTTTSVAPPTTTTVRPTTTTTVAPTTTTVSPTTTTVAPSPRPQPPSSFWARLRELFSRFRGR